MEVKALIEEKVSKSGNPYTAIVIYITDKVTKTVFLTPAELELIKMKKQDNEIPSFLN